MKKEDVKYGAYVQILKEELVPAMDVPSRSHWPMRRRRRGKFLGKSRIKCGSAQVEVLLRTLNL